MPKDAALSDEPWPTMRTSEVPRRSLVRILARDEDGGGAGAVAAVQLGDEPVAVAAVDRLDELERVALVVEARTLEEERGGVERHAEGGGLLLAGHGGLDRLDAARDLDAVAGVQQLVER